MTLGTQPRLHIENSATGRRSPEESVVVGRSMFVLWPSENPVGGKSMRQFFKGTQLSLSSSKTVLFLDVDGVLNQSGNSQKGLDAGKVALLKQIVDQTGCGIVVSSTWRKFEHSRRAIVDCIVDIGGVLRGFTPQLSHQGEVWAATPRGIEIEAWLLENREVNHFVILDDDDEMGGLIPHLVQTNSADGLTVEIAAEVIRRLNLPTQRTCS